MSQPFLGEITCFPYNFAPFGWSDCDGQLLPISQYTALFSLLGTQFGGNGTSNFALPNLQGNAPMNQGSGPGLTPRTMGEAGGEPAVTLLTTQLPAHRHTALCQSNVGAVGSPLAQVWAAEARGRTPAYTSTAPNVALHSQALATAGGNLPHNNMSPYVVVIFIIALQGVFPARN
jgi:microcystin-dependent protein